ncbi:hypothetical protein [Massilia sp. METH4]|uniref:hypothetical protein n=1 Tax=Massilia sp. METH4 TaxID=3123041 RepID=UPI0030D523F0
MKTIFLGLGVLAAGAAHAGTDVDLRVTRYSKVVTAEGVTREARYEETVLRRAGNVWTARVLPASVAPHGHDHDAGPHKAAARQSVGHKHFNPVTLPRHVALQDGKLKLRYVDPHAREVIAIPPGEYDNVGFDGSWDHAYYLLDTKGLRAMRVTQRPSTVAGARWRERERDGLFERVLWDDANGIPLVIESGDKAGTVYYRTELKVAGNLTRDLPWQKLKGYAQREYADYLD